MDKRQSEDTGQNDLSLLGLLAVDEEDCRAGDCHDGGQRDEAGARARAHRLLLALVSALLYYPLGDRKFTC